MNESETQKVVVIGGCGYIGTMLVPRLLLCGYKVSVIDLTWFGNHLPKSVQVEITNAMNLVEEDLAGTDTVIYLSGMSNDPMAEYSPLRNYIENSAAPAYLAYIAKRAGVRRFIHGGSCSVYGLNENELLDESSPTLSKHAYGISKLMGEVGALQLIDDSFSVIGLRKGTVSGFSPRMRLDLVVNTMFSEALNAGKIKVNNPVLWRPILAIQDAVEAYLRAVEAAPEISGLFNIASGNFTIAEIAHHVSESIKEFLGLEVPIIINNTDDIRSYKANWEKASTLLGFFPNYNIKDIVRDLVENREYFSNANDPIFYNIETLKKRTS